MQKEMQELDCEDGYVLMVGDARQEHKPPPPPVCAAQTLQFASNGVNKQSKNTILLAMARTSSASSYASGQAVEKMALKARARPATSKVVVMKTIMSNDDDANTNNAIVDSPESQKSMTQQSSGQHQATSQNITAARTPALVRQDEDVIVVETVNEHEDDDDFDDASGQDGNASNHHHEERNDMCDFSTFEYNPPHEAKNVISMAMTILAAILIFAVTALVFKWTHHNGLVTASVWLVMALIFLGLNSIVREQLKEDTRTTRQVLGFPLWWEIACTEYRDFKQDWREQVMLLKNEAENPIPNVGPSTSPTAAIEGATIGGDAAANTAFTSSFKNDTEPATVATKNINNSNSKRSFVIAGRKSHQQDRYHHQQQQQPQPQSGFEKRPKSKIFRAFIKPLLPVMIGQKGRERRREALELASRGTG
jgi:hypothetical protein